MFRDLRKKIKHSTELSPFFNLFWHSFKVMILESGDTRWFGMGVVYEDYDLNKFPGWRDGTVGYHTDDRLIFDAQNPNEGKKTTGEASNIFMKRSLSSLGRNS